MSLIVGLATTPLGAQQTIGRAMGPSVSVDYGVLDSLGPAPTLPSLLLGNMVRPPARVYGARAPRFPVLRGADAVMPTDRIVLIPPGKKRAARKATKRKRRAASTTTPRRKTASAPRRAKAKPVAPPRRVTRTPIPPPTPPPEVPSMPLTPIPLIPAPMTPTPPPAIASLPPPPALPTAPAVGTPPPAPTSKPIAKPKPAAKPQPRRVAKPKPAPRKPPRAERAPRKPVKTASLPRETAAPPRAVQVLFGPGSAKLDKAATVGMKRIADAMNSDASMRIQLLAYAGGASMSASQARRLSLSRALAARSYLIGRGVRSTRIDVRALGNKSSAGPLDRIDLMVVRR